MTQGKLLDLFGGQGGAAMGYYRAGFDVWSVDLVDQPRNSFHALTADWRVGLDRLADWADVIHASPPCQAYSVTRHTHSNVYPDLVGEVRRVLDEIGKPYVIENVVGAPLIDPYLVCGAAMGLVAYDPQIEQGVYLRRHRLFECSEVLAADVGCYCEDDAALGYQCASVEGNGPSDNRGGRNGRRGGYTPRVAVRRELCGTPWMNREGIAQAVPPAYTSFIGEKLLDALRRKGKL